MMCYTITSVSKSSYTFLIRILQICLFFVLSVSSRAEAQQLGYALSAGGSGPDEARSIAVSQTGEVVQVGTFSGSAVFGMGEINETTLISSGGTDIFIAKYNSIGKLLWVKQAGGTQNDAAFSVSLTSNGEVVFTGRFNAIAVFGANEPNEMLLTSTGRSDIFVARLRGSGSLRWAISAGGGLDDVAEDIVVFSGSDVAISGRFNSTAVFGAGEPNETQLSSNGGFDIFIAHYNSDGQLQWARQAGGSGNDGAEGITSNSFGHLLITGSFRESAVFGLGEVNETTLVSSGGEDVFLAVYVPQGDFFWARRAGGSGNDAALAASLNSQGNYSCTGAFSATAVFGPGEANETILTSNGSTDIFVANYSAIGDLLWVKQAGGTGTDIGRDVFSDEFGNNFIGGDFQSTAVFGGGEANETLLNSNGSTDAAIAKYDVNGSLEWAASAGGSDAELGFSVAGAGNGEAYLSGYFTGSAVFGSGEPNETVLNSAGSSDAFHAFYGVDAPSDTLIWTKSSSNPILSVSNNGWENYYVHSCGIKDGGEYKLYFSGMVPNQIEIGLATSTDGISWTKYPTNQNPQPVIPRGVQSWSSFRTVVGTMLKVGGTYYAFYYGDNQNLNANGSIGLATSADGINWTQHPQNPVIAYQDVTNGENGINQPEVIYKDGLFHIYFRSQRVYDDWHYGTSSDGVNWTIESNPPDLDLPKGTYKIRYLNGVHYAQEAAELGQPFSLWLSSDGKSWQESHRGTLLPYQPWQNQFQSNFSLMLEDNENLRIFFTGEQGQWGPTMMGIAEAQVNVTTPPAITVISPNGGENWEVGSQQNIQWSSTGVNAVDIYYSTDGGNTLQPIDSAVPAADQSYSWTIPGPPSADCIVFISEDNNLAVADESDMGFEISGPPSLLILDAYSTPIANKLFRISEINPDLSETIIGEFTTDQGGRIAYQPGWFEHGDKIKVTRVIFTQSATKHTGLEPVAFIIELSNIKVSGQGEISFDSFTGANTIPVQLDNTLILFNLVVSVEWDASSDYLLNLQQGFRYCSNTLYDASNGQLAINKVYIFDNKVNWYEADIRISAHNSLRAETTILPSEYDSNVNKRNGGGWIIEESLIKMPRIQYSLEKFKQRSLAHSLYPYDWTLAATDGETHYLPSKSLAHELMHYTIGILDEYQDEDKNTVLPGFNFGLMDDVLGFQPIDTEISGSGEYADPSHQVTAQYTLRSNRSSWDFFQWSFEDNYDNIIAPIHIPQTIIEGPNNDLELPDYDVGMQMLSRSDPPVDVLNNGKTLNLIARHFGLPVPAAKVTLVKVTTSQALEQGFCTLLGKIQVLGTNQGDLIRIHGSLPLIGEVYKEIILGQNGFTNVGLKTNPTIVNDSLVVELDAVKGDVDILTQISFVADNVLHYSVRFNAPRSSNPTLEVMNNVDPPQSFELTTSNGQGEYSKDIPVAVNNSGAFTLFTSDDSLNSIFIESTYINQPVAMGEFIPSFSNSDGTCQLLLDSLNIEQRSILISSGRFISPNAGLSESAERVSDAHTIAILPDNVDLIGENRLRIYYDNQLISPQAGEYLQVFRWGHGSDQWQIIGGQPDTISNSISVSINRGGTYAVFTTDMPVSIDYRENKMDNYYLHTNYPNPFNPSTRIRYGLPKASKVTIEVYDVLGQRITTLVNKRQVAGHYNVEFTGNGYPSGMYFYKIQAGNFEKIGKMVLMK